MTGVTPTPPLPLVNGRCTNKLIETRTIILCIYIELNQYKQCMLLWFGWRQVYRVEFFDFFIFADVVFFDIIYYGHVG